MNWLNKMDEVYNLIRTQAAAYWDIAFAVAVVMSAFALFAIAKDPSQSTKMRRKSRLLRYCHDCPFSDSFTETCTIAADKEEKCGLIDQTAGMKFDVVKK